MGTIWGRRSYRRNEALVGLMMAGHSWGQPWYAFDLRRNRSQVDNLRGFDKRRGTDRERAIPVFAGRRIPMWGVLGKVGVAVDNCAELDPHFIDLTFGEPHGLEQG
jgi:hypothetical protein